MLGRKQRSQVVRSFPNRYQFSCTNKVTSLFSMSCILRIILERETMGFKKEFISLLFSEEYKLVEISVLFRYFLIHLCHFVAYFANMTGFITLVQTLQYG